MSQEQSLMKWYKIKILTVCHFTFKCLFSNRKVNAEKQGVYMVIDCSHARAVYPQTNRASAFEIECPCNSLQPFRTL